MSLIKNLIYKKGHLSLEIPSWKFKDNCIILLSGPSGCGKTTLLNLLAGLISCPSLIWEFKGQDLTKYSPEQRKISYCFQDLRLFPLMTAKDNILFVLKAKKLTWKSKQNDFEDIVKSLNLEKCLNLSIEKLSGGEKQRVALARALIAPQSILFLDEPFSYLDEEHKKRARDMVFKIARKHSLSVLLVSHEKESQAEQTFELKQGKITIS